MSPLTKLVRFKVTACPRHRVRYTPGLERDGNLRDSYRHPWVLIDI